MLHLLLCGEEELMDVSCFCPCPGSQGVFCEVQPTDHQRMEFLTKLGFLEILRGEARSREGVVLGRLL